MLSEKKSISEIYDVIIVGAGLAGLINAILLSRSGFKVLLLEKKFFPFHKVCGEYISNEVISFLTALGFKPSDYGASKINQLRISDPSGKSIKSELGMGGFGISRFIMDHALMKIACEVGVDVKENNRVTDLEFFNDVFKVVSSSGIYSSHFVIGSYGKRDVLDKNLNRSFMTKHTGYMGVKYHVKLNYPLNEIGLDNFPGGYCGIVKIEDDKYNLCYLYQRRPGVEFKSIAELEQKVLFTNPVIKKYFSEAEYVLEKPEVINEISFDRKPCVENNLFFCGDAAGLITPLCGNGMAMAIHAAKILSEILIHKAKPGIGINTNARQKIEKEYRIKWEAAFASRLFWGRNLQKISGNPMVTKTSLKVFHTFPGLTKWLIGKTHGSEQLR